MLRDYSNVGRQIFRVVFPVPISTYGHITMRSLPNTGTVDDFFIVSILSLLLIKTTTVDIQDDCNFFKIEIVRRVVYIQHESIMCLLILINICFTLELCLFCFVQKMAFKMLGSADNSII